MTLGNTTFTLLDTYVDQPNPKGNPKNTAYSCKTGSDSCLAAQSGNVPSDLLVPTPLAGTTQGAGRETRNV